MQDPNVDYVILAEGEERLPLFLASLGRGDADFEGLDGIGYQGVRLPGDAGDQLHERQPAIQGDTDRRSAPTCHMSMVHSPMVPR